MGHFRAKFSILKIYFVCFYLLEKKGNFLRQNMIYES